MPAPLRLSIASRAASLVLLAVMAVRAPHAAVTVERVDYEGWKQAYRISNEDAELVIVPEIARIMHYSFLGGENTLWVNPQLKGKKGSRDDWRNFGGDKAWIWPQSAWRSKWGNWPPPYECDQAPHQAAPIPGSGVATRSDLVKGYGIRIFREIRLAPRGTRVEIKTALNMTRRQSKKPMAAWSITQMPEPESLLARLLPSSRMDKPWKQMNDTKWKSVYREGKQFLRLKLPKKAAKAGMDADLLAWVRKGILFSQTLQLGSLTDSRMPLPGDMAQVFSSPREKNQEAYVELELTSPRVSAIERRDAKMVVVWELKRLPANARATSAALKILRGK